MRLTITDPGTLLPILADREVSATQALQVLDLLNHGPLATLSLAELRVAQGALTALEDPFSDEQSMLVAVTTEVHRRDPATRISADAPLTIEEIEAALRMRLKYEALRDEQQTTEVTDDPA